MSFIAAVILFLIFVIAHIIVSDVFTVLFRLTGLAEDKARFQVVSLLTNSGYTTQESEIVVTGKIRRRLARMGMISGYAFTVIIVSIIINVIMQVQQAELEHMLTLLPLGLVILCTFFIVRRLKPVKNWFDTIIERLGNRIMFGPKSNPVVYLDSYGETVIAEVQLRNVPEEFAGKKLSETGLKEKYDITVLLTRHGERSNKRHTVQSDLVLKQNDVIVIFGPMKNVRALFERPNTRRDDA